MHNYPKGAIKDEKELFFHLLGKPLYHVHGLGESSYLTVMNNVRALRTVTIDHDNECRVFDFDNMDINYVSTCYLPDCNIGEHYNFHYLFSNLKDAEEYLIYAKTFPNKRKNPCTKEKNICFTIHKVSVMYNML